MADITMCDDNHCPLNKTCYRYLAEPNEYRQSYYGESPYNRETETCDHYWEACEYCGQPDHKLSCPTQKIVVNLNNQ